MFGAVVIVAAQLPAADGIAILNWSVEAQPDLLGELLRADDLAISPGLELLDQQLRVVADISAALASGEVAHDTTATVHGSFSFEIAQALSWGVDLVRPFVVLSGAGLTRRFDLGVFAPVTPTQPVGETPATYSVTGYDRLYLLNRPVGDTLTIAAGTGYLAAVVDTITAAGLDPATVRLDTTAGGLTLPDDVTWPLIPTATAGSGSGPATWLGVVNELLGAVGYDPLWCDADGFLRSEPATDPATRTPTFALSADDVHSIGITDRMLIQDLWQVPNTWVFVQQTRAADAPAASEGDGIYTVTNQAAGPSSISARNGMVWAQVVTIDAADQATLVALGQQQVAAALRGSQQITATTGPMPSASHLDVYTLDDADLGAAGWRVSVASWRFDIFSGTHSWVWERVA